ncbi:MAG: yeats-domain-containing protein [Monoraphidium minutum]|nr:MAG: yeats-domain-containing protein [Monoraphidium minutum]
MAAYDYQAPPGGTRLRNTEFTYPIVFGTIAFALGKKATDAATHRWTAYVRGINNEDLSHLLQKVTFNLHASFNNPSRAVAVPPFELTEEGWGEFEMSVVLHFQPDAQEPPIEVYHHLRLYEDGEVQGVPLSANKKPVVSENIEELVFSEPHEGFYRRVMATPMRALQAPSILTGHVGRPENEAAELQQISEVRQRVAMAAAAVKNAAALEQQAAQAAAQAAAAAAAAAAQGVVQQGQPMAM